MFGVNPFGWPYFGQGYAGTSSSTQDCDLPFISSATTVYDLAIETVALPFIASVTVLYALTLPEVALPFISSQTVVFGVYNLFTDDVGSGPGNGGEGHQIQLAANGASHTATLAADLSSVATLLSLTGDSALPSTGGFCLTIDSEVIYCERITAGSYRVRGRAQSNTLAASHSSGATATWNDSYDMAIIATDDIATSFTANITGSGSTTYPGWLICFDSSQAYLSSSRYAMHVTSVLGVFDAGGGSSGSNRCDAAQPNSISRTAGTTDECPAALSNPSRIQTDILTGDVALVRYTNPESSVLTLGPRAAALQAWYGIKRVNSSDVDVTFTDPTGTVVDGTINGEWNDPLGPGISPDTGDPTNHDVPYTSVTLLGSSRTFTHGGTPSPPNFNEKGWPICALAVRQGNRRIPFWRSWDWHNYNYVYSGFDTDATFCQIVINRNGIVFGSVPEVALPGSQDIDGPDAVWDDGSYEFGASWYVAIFAGPYLVVGPSLGGAGGTAASGGSGGFAPVVAFPGGPGSPSVNVPTVEGGSGGGISPPTTRKQRFDATLV